MAIASGRGIRVSVVHVRSVGIARVSNFGKEVREGRGVGVVGVVDVVGVSFLAAGE